MKKFEVVKEFNDSENKLKTMKEGIIIDNLTAERESVLKGNNKHGIVYIKDYKEPKQAKSKNTVSQD